VNPYGDGANTVAEGARLYRWMNCAGCHGGQGGGGIGPPFADADWIYGGEPENIYQSIVQGRPNGMPSYHRLPPSQVWPIVAYVRSLGPAQGQGGERAHSGLGTGEAQETGRGGRGGGR
jgi:cytochrome c oxidase cbb3-type subunit III